FDTRQQFRKADPDSKIRAVPYKPLPPPTLFLTEAEWKAALGRHLVRDLPPCEAPESKPSMDAGGGAGRDFAPERAGGNLNVFQAAADHLTALQKSGKRVLVASWTEGSAERMGGVLTDHGLPAIRRVKDWPDALKLSSGAVGLACLGIERGFETPDFALMSEQDVLGDRMVRAQARQRRSQNFLAEAS